MKEFEIRQKNLKIVKITTVKINNYKHDYACAHPMSNNKLLLRTNSTLNK